MGIGQNMIFNECEQQKHAAPGKSGSNVYLDGTSCVGSPPLVPLFGILELDGRTSGAACVFLVWCKMSGTASKFISNTPGT